MLKLKHLLVVACTGAVLSMSGSLSAAPIGHVVNFNNNLITVDLATGIPTTIGSLGVAGDFEGLAFSPGGILFASNDTNNSIYTVNTTTGAATFVGGTGITFINSGLSFRADGTLFLADDSFDMSAVGSGSLYTVDTGTGAATLVGTHNRMLNALAFAADGTLFSVDLDTDELVTLDTMTGMASVIGNLGIDLVVQQGLDFDASGTLYMMDEAGAIYTIDTITGAATLVVSVPNTFYENLAILKTVMVPEPGTLALLSLGLAGFGFARRKRS